jgi:arabinan endo-1,5-alpha-L-arabinosidase
VAGDEFRGGTFIIESERSGYVLDLAVEAVHYQGPPRRRGFGGFGRNTGNTEPIPPIPTQDVAEVSKTWPEGNIELRLSDYMIQAHQKWTITPVEGVGGYLGSPYFKITIEGTDRALAATEDAELVTLPAFTGGVEQLWQIDQLIDGTWRIMPKAAPGFAITAVGVSTPSLVKFEASSDNGRWNFKKP